MDNRTIIQTYFLPFLLFFILRPCGLVAQQTFTISGYVTDSLSGESLNYATIYEKHGRRGTVTNEAGFFSITLSAGKTELHVTYVGCDPQIIRFDLYSDKSLNILMRSKPLDEILVAAERSPISLTVGGAHQMSLKKMDRLPVILGEPDIVKSLQLLPGIQAGSEGSVGLSIRGGSPDQNLILLDGLPLYNISHAYGFFSIFNSDALNDVTAYKGNFPARYGDRLSSVIDVRTREGNRNHLAGNVSISLVAAKAMIEGPLNDRTTFFVSARRSYIDLVAKRFFEHIFDYSDGTYFFYDMNAKVTHRFSENSKLSGGLYLGNDNEDYQRTSAYTSNIEKTDTKWGNLQGNLIWNYSFSPKWYGNYSAGYTRYRMFSQNDFNYLTDEYDMKYITHYRSSISDLTQKANFQFTSTANHRLRFGESFTASWFFPRTDNQRIEKNQTEISTDTLSASRKVQTNQLTFYAEDEIWLTSNIQVNAGLRYSSYFTESKTYHTFDPRFAILWHPLPELKLRTGFTHNHQFIHLLSSASLNMATDILIPSTSEVRPQNGYQISGGMEWEPSGKFKFTMEGYYKKMHSLIEYKEGASYLVSHTEWENEVTTGKGEMYGVEFMIEKEKGKATGWIAYAISKSTRQFDEINKGKPFPYQYDRRHDLKIVFNYAFSKSWDIGAVWFFNTGNHLTVATQKFYYHLYYQRNGYQTPNHHRLDMSLNYRRQKKKRDTVWSLEIYNVYNRKNIYSVQAIRDFRTPNIYELQEKSLFRLIPSISYKIKFGKY